MDIYAEIGKLWSYQEHLFVMHFFQSIGVISLSLFHANHKFSLYFINIHTEFGDLLLDLT